MIRCFRASPATVLAALVLVAVASGCQSGEPVEQGPIALKLSQTDGPLILHVRSDAFDSGEEIPLKNTSYGMNVSPSLGWSGVPMAAKSLAIIVEDPDTVGAQPYSNWVVYNIPTELSSIPPGLAQTDRPVELHGGMQGSNSAGSIGYFGPKPLQAAPAHHYHFQVFALDVVLPLGGGAGRDGLVAAMTGHVVAKGEVVGTYRE